MQFDKDTWILRGAATAVNYLEGPAKIINTTPQPGQYLYSAAGVSEIEIQFSEAVTHKNSDITVVGNLSGARNFTSTYSSADYRLTLNFGQPLAGGEMWTITVSDEVLTQSSGYAIDGELAGSGGVGATQISMAQGVMFGPPCFPSGDGVPGGVGVFVFYAGYSGDLTMDNKVDASDFALLATHWEQRSCGECDGADLTGDGNVGIGDLGVLMADWLAGVP